MVGLGWQEAHACVRPCLRRRGSHANSLPCRSSPGRRHMGLAAHPSHIFLCCRPRCLIRRPPRRRPVQPALRGHRAHHGRAAERAVHVPDHAGAAALAPRRPAGRHGVRQGAVRLLPLLHGLHHLLVRACSRGGRGGRHSASTEAPQVIAMSLLHGLHHLLVRPWVSRGRGGRGCACTKGPQVTAMRETMVHGLHHLLVRPWVSKGRGGRGCAYTEAPLEGAGSRAVLQ